MRKVKGKSRYIPIFCETRRKMDMESFGPRGGGPLITERTGRAYASQVGGDYRCLTCGEKMSVILG